MGDFLEGAKGLTRNPLGIIALFIALVYAMATGFLALSAEKLEHCERMPIIWFIVLFPLVVLAVFGYLVRNHHEKLYGPGDYRGDEGFLNAMKRQNEIQHEARVDEEVRQLSGPQNGEAAPLLTGELPTPANMGAAPLHESPESPDTLSALRGDVVLAEELALRKLAQEGHKDFKTHVSHTQFPSIAFDAVFSDTDDEINFVEVRFLRDRLPSTQTLTELVHRVQAGFFGKQLPQSATVKLLLIFVVTGNRSPQEITSFARKRLGNTPFPVEIRVYDFEKLKEDLQ